MSRRNAVADTLISTLITIAVVSLAAGLAVVCFTAWPREMAMWLAGVVAGLLAGPSLRKVPALAAARLAGERAIPTPGRRGVAARRCRKRRR
ncbi:hypothetical protein HNP84_002603 [Thermocatellispora tengchongensis]|uniref:Uncharacterized protein n=1 Tax=Thermocatellispora tengchongensis TaxID=1073253 RepID=A0A840P0H4_9ACTN|nr:hypothetical protein [Thermocatellispora tengchongensis]MBB5132882.1 hypothetical protein [Thermocatellispora tengchongensis]